MVRRREDGNSVGKICGWPPSVRRVGLGGFCDAVCGFWLDRPGAGNLEGRGRAGIVRHQQILVLSILRAQAGPARSLAIRRVVRCQLWSVALAVLPSRL